MSCFNILSLIDGGKLILISASFLSAIVLLVALKKFNLSSKGKIALIYGHLGFLFFPFILLSVNTTCGFLCMPSCYNNLFSLALYALPSTLLLTTIAGFLVIPSLFLLTNKKRRITDGKILDVIKSLSEKENISEPRVYAVDSAKPFAFSFKTFRSAIFLSVGLLDILKFKELEAVIIHELGHIANKSSILKLSSRFLRMFSPFSLLAKFNHDLGEDEKLADSYVFRYQGTWEYLNSAKSKVDDFCRKEKLAF